MLPALVHGFRHHLPLQCLQLAAVWKPHMHSSSAASTSRDIAAAAAAAAASIHSSASTLQQQQQQQQQHHPKQLLPDGVIILPMPSLSHAMERGTVKRWLKQEGELCQEYDLVLEVETETLVEEAYRLDDFAGKVTLLIEANEEAWLAKQLVPEGSELPVGKPIALLCEEQQQLPEAAAQAAAVAQVRSVYEHEAEKAQSVRTLVWQSYLKESNKEPGSSCGCM